MNWLAFYFVVWTGVDEEMSKKDFSKLVRDSENIITADVSCRVSVWTK